jgi:hypothetical protein
MSPGVRCFLRLPWPLARALLDLPAATQPIRVLPTTHVLNQPRSALIPRPSAVPPPRRARAPPDPLHREWAGTMLGPVGGGRGGWRPDWGDAASVHPPILATATVRDALSCSLLPAGSPSRKPACVCLCLSLPRAHASEHFSPAILRDLLLPLDSTDTPSTAPPTRRNGLLTSAEKASLPSPTPCTDRLESQGALLSAPPARPLARAFLGLRAVPLSLRHRLEPRLELRDPPLERLMRCCSALHGSERRHSGLLGNVRAYSETFAPNHHGCSHPLRQAQYPRSRPATRRPRDVSRHLAVLRALLCGALRMFMHMSMCHPCGARERGCFICLPNGSGGARNV